MQNNSFRPNGLKVSIDNNNGTIRLRFTYQGKRESISYPLNYFDPQSQQIAIAKATEIHNDIYLYQKYDETKEKYQLKPKLIKHDFGQKELTLREIWEFYKELKRDDIAVTTKKNNWSKIDKTLSENLTVDEVADYVILLLSKYAKTTTKRLLQDLSASIGLAISFGKFKGDNHVIKIIESLGVHKKKTIKSFTQEEVTVILNAFKYDQYLPEKALYNYSYYYNFVAFRFLTGTRPSEAIAVTCNDIFKKAGKTWLRINKRYVGGEIVMGTKNGVDIRMFPVNDQLKDLIESIPKIDNPNNLLFPSITKTYIDRKNFSTRIWKPLILQLVNQGLVKEYLTFYDVRHTFITHLCRSGKADLQTIANIVGNSVPTLIRNYLAVDESLELPELF
ncbi:MAG: tyrosine-type recombinase/integrase [Cyanobacterium sp. T60_A2020_053]|nr:tyrosine-type recombinase/integrase [Cyanobacterium sp. T60_A2020_053]MBF2056268.1 tyrosine-type recombinase/integrase [Cyanobacterium sp. T60_A2020_053]